MSTVESYDFKVLHIIRGAVASILRYQRYRWQRKEFVLLLLEDYDQNVRHIHPASAKLMMRFGRADIRRRLIRMYGFNALLSSSVACDHDPNSDFSSTVEIRFGDELSGDVIAVNAGVEWQLLKHFNLGLLYRYFRVDVNTKGEARQLTIDYKYKGPVLYAGWSF